MQGAHGRTRSEAGRACETPWTVPSRAPSAAGLRVLQHIPSHTIPTPRGFPGPGPSRGGCSPPREGAGHPGARHGASPAPGHGPAPLGSAPVRQGNCRYRHLYSARHRLGFSWTDENKRGRRGGRGSEGWGGEKEDSSTDVGCHGRRYNVTRATRADEPREAAAAPGRHVGAGRRRCLRSRRLVPRCPRLQALEEEGVARSPPGAVAELPDAGSLPHGALLPGVALRGAAAGNEGGAGGGTLVPSRPGPSRPSWPR